MTAVLEQLITAEPDEGKRRKLAMVRDILIQLVPVRPASSPATHRRLAQSVACG